MIIDDILVLLALIVSVCSDTRTLISPTHTQSSTHHYRDLHVGDYGWQVGPDFISVWSNTRTLISPTHTNLAHITTEILQWLLYPVIMDGRLVLFALIVSVCSDTRTLNSPTQTNPALTIIVLLKWLLNASDYGWQDTMFLVVLIVSLWVMPLGLEIL